MIPLSVRMTGWMRYRDETVADFTNGTLIAICGENGAGKSSIFDAITYALYGQTRLGKMDVKDLISEGRHRLSVDFEFEQQGTRYLVRRGRTDKATGADQSIFFWDDEKQDYVQVPGSEKKDAMQRVIEQVVRLSEKAFTSSFILQQGEATQFIDSDPKDRFQIISSLIGLKEYEALEKAAREGAKVEKILLDNVTPKINEFGGIDAEAVERLRTEVTALAAAETDAADMLQRARSMVEDARRYGRLSGEIAALDATIANAQELLARKDKIESDAALFEMLAGALAGVERIQHALADASRAEAVAEDASRQAAAIDVDALARAHEDAMTAMDASAKALAVAEAAHETAQEAERAASDFAQVAVAVLQGRARVVSFDEQVAAIDARLKEMSGVAKKVDAEAAATMKAYDEADTALEVARKDGAAARARADALKDEVAQRKASAKEATCSRCGQKIDKAAAKKQLDELSAALDEAQASAKTATAADQTAMKARASAKKALDDASAAAAKHAQQISRLDGERATAVVAREGAATALAEQEGRLDGRLKDVDKAEAGHAKSQQALMAAQTVLREARASHDRAQQDADAARDAVANAKQRTAELQANIAEQTATAAGCRRLAETTAGGLGELGERALEDPAEVLTALRKNQKELAEAPKLKTALEQAMKAHDDAAAQRTAKQSEVDAIPAAHQVDEDAAVEALQMADEASARAREAHRSAQKQLTMAEARVEQIAGLQEDKARADLRYKRLTKLTKLLGKNGLQGELVRGAITDVKNHANAFLKRLTGGALELTLEEVKGALELKAIDHSCMREARSAKALSGSQKFRCAVAIASGIGQYAGSGGMRSIVIDEGFGSLDIDSQKMMVDELKLLAQHMDKVIVVSHLESFMDPANFPDRLDVRQTADGASTISRVA